MAAHIPALAIATARRGTPDPPTTESHAGAYPDRASENNIRVAVYKFVLALDSAAEITTRFIIPAAYGIPAAANARTNGLPVMLPPSSAIRFHGVIVSITEIASR